ncbi:MAG: rod shape-determining protein [Paludibacteraceae bacterium]|nr:rod shape-determining protein [Paludibacteraceae bacterium]
MAIYYGKISIIKKDDAQRSGAYMLVNISGEHLNQDIEDYLGRMYNFWIDSPMVDEIRLTVGSALSKQEEEPIEMTVKGRNKLTYLPQQLTVSSKGIFYCLDRSLQYIEKEIEQTLNSVHSKIYDDIVKNGICLTGSGASLRGLAERFEAKTNIHCYVS